MRTKESGPLRTTGNDLAALAFVVALVLGKVVAGLPAGRGIGSPFRTLFSGISRVNTTSSNKWYFMCTLSERRAQGNGATSTIVKGLFPCYISIANSTNQDDYHWGRLHRIVFAHPLGGVFSVPPANGAVNTFPGKFVA